jgi:hypothetical protein
VPSAIIACHAAHDRRSSSQDRDLPTEVIGFHGTSKQAVPHLLAGNIQPSDQHFEWLGTGFYVWQDSPWRARQWAAARFGPDAAVVVARVDLDGCLDLLNPAWQAELHDADFEFVIERITGGLSIPVNTETGNHARDGRGRPRSQPSTETTRQPGP